MFLLKAVDAGDAGAPTASFFAGLMAAVASVVVIAVLLPFFATFVLDGLVLLARGKGSRGLLVAIAIVIAVAGIGYLLLAFSREGASSSSSSSSSVFESAAAFLLPWSIAAALLAFVVRQGRRVLQQR